MYENSSKVVEIDINEILPNRFQPRIQFDEEEILELSDSIKEHGVIQPIVVRTIGDKYEIIAGERRYKASVLAGKETVPVIVKNLNDKDSAEIALIENIQRKNLTPIEEALSYKKILDMGYLTQENLASKLGKSQSSVANKIRLLNLSDEVQEALLENKISERHARSLLKLSTSKLQNEMLNRIVSERLTVRKADEEIEKLKNQTLDDNDEEQKIREKGEINMNNNMFGINSIPQTEQPTLSNFDIFGGSAPIQSEIENVMEPSVSNQIPQASASEVQPMVESTVPNMEPMMGMQFDLNGSTAQVPQASAPEVQPMVGPVVPNMEPMMGMQFDLNGSTAQIPQASAPEVQPLVESTVPNMEPMMGMQFDLNGSTAQVPQASAPEVQPMVGPTVPNMEPMMEMQFDLNGSTAQIPQASAPEVQPMVESTVPNMEPMMGMQFDLNGSTVQMPSIPSEESIVPATSPILESQKTEINNEMTQQSENLFSFGDNNLNSTEIQTEQPTSEFKIPEPIIITDFSKQYDPVMPQTLESMGPIVDFKEVINAIRECSSKIEKYGFKIDTEEYDLEKMYQVIFKIEK